MRQFASLTSLMMLGLLSTSARADFINGGFEDGTFNGWTQSGGIFLGGTNYNYNAQIGFRGAIESPGNDPIVGAALNRVFSGNHSARVEDIAINARFSQITQAVAWTDPDIFFAFAAVFQDPGHTNAENPHLRVTLRNETQGVDLYSQFYESNNVGTAVDIGSHKYIPWQVVNLNLSGLLPTQFQSGDTLRLSLIGSDCSQTGHGGYVYLDGFGATVPTAVPAPPALLLAAIALPIVGLKRIRRNVGL